MSAPGLLERLALHTPYLSTTQYLPAFVYGTAWKKETTAELVYQALANGFTGIDTANQPKHYREDLVGAGIRKAISEKKITRSDIYLQTKFTSVGGQDLQNIPYNPKASIAEQVKTSVEVSLQHLRLPDTDDGIESAYLDALILHSPLPTFDETLEAWETLEQYVPHKIRCLGISNCNLFTLMDLYERASVKPAIVQNRFYANTKYDIGLRKFCTERSIVYQSFWTLTANPALLKSAEVELLSSLLGISPQAALYGLVLGLGNTVILNGTTKQHHMRQDFQAFSRLRHMASRQPGDWSKVMAGFRSRIGQARG